VIVPSIDLMDGEAVQLVGGRTKALSAGDPRPIARRFGLAGEVAVVDLDGALGRGSNAACIRELLRIAPCRVGGGIRDVTTAIDWLDAGATKIVLGTAATPEVLARLPAERVIAALDADNGEVVVEGWRRGTGESILDRMRRLRGLVGGFLVTFVEREGRLGGTNMDLVPALVEAAGSARVTIAGGITMPAEIAELDRLGADAQVGMALYTGAMDLADAIAAPLTSDRGDSLWPTVVVDEVRGALGLAYSSRESLRRAVAQGRGIYHSRKRGVWVKGGSSGNTQELLRVDLDCDRDCLRFTVRQKGAGFCHSGASTCWGPAVGLQGLERRLAQGIQRAGSYTQRLLNDSTLLRAKLMEEAAELADAPTHADAALEATDLLYFVMVAMRRSGVTLAEVAREFDRRALRVTRRPGNAKPVREAVR
jgi:phosphoribosylformimino-5-aminoimidazole carboxamide ribotide isomerase